MTDQARHLKMNYLAILVAGIANFVFEAVWYSCFMNGWLNGIGRTKEWLMSSGVNPNLQYLVALVCACVIAGSIACLTQITGPQTALRGIQTGFSLWAGLVVTTFATEYVFEVRPWSLVGINLGFWLIGMMLMGAIVGAWKKK
jgi:hypothetical protein